MTSSNSTYWLRTQSQRELIAAAKAVCESPKKQNLETLREAVASSEAIASRGRGRPRSK